MRRSRLAVAFTLTVVLISLLVLEHYTGRKSGDETKSISPKVSENPLSRHKFWPNRNRDLYSDKVNSILNDMRAHRIPIYADQVLPKYEGEINGAGLFKQAIDIIQKAGEDSALRNLGDIYGKKGAYTAEDLQNIRMWLSDGDVEEVMDLVRQASEADHIDFNLDYSKGAEMSFDHLSPIRNVMKLFNLNSKVALLDGDIEGAVNDTNSALKFNMMASDNVSLISELVEYSGTKILIENMADLRNSGADLTETHKILEVDLLTSHDNQMNTMDGERIFFGDWFFEKALKNPEEFDLKEHVGLLGHNEEGVALKLSKEQIQEQHAQFLEGMVKVRELMEEPYHINKEEMKAQQELFKSSDSIFIKLLMPTYSTIYKKYNEQQVMLKKNLLSLSLDEYKRSKGEYPESLADMNIPKDYLIDNISGKPFVMKKDQSGNVSILTEIEAFEKL